MGTGEGHALSQLLHYVFSFLLCLCRVALAPRIGAQGITLRHVTEPSLHQTGTKSLGPACGLRDSWGVQCSHREHPASPTDGHFVVGAVGISGRKTGPGSATRPQGRASLAPVMGKMYRIYSDSYHLSTGSCLLRTESWGKNTHLRCELVNLQASEEKVPPSNLEGEQSGFPRSPTCKVARCWLVPGCSSVLDGACADGCRQSQLPGSLRVRRSAGLRWVSGAQRVIPRGQALVLGLAE